MKKMHTVVIYFGVFFIRIFKKYINFIVNYDNPNICKVNPNICQPYFSCSKHIAIIVTDYLVLC